MPLLSAVPHVSPHPWSFSVKQLARTALPSKVHCRSQPDGRDYSYEAPKTQDRPAEGYRALQAGDRLRPNLSGAYELLANEALAMGVPQSALPTLPEDPTFEDVQRVYTRLQGIMASFQSADI